MKIALTTDTYDKAGGISRYIAELAERFAKEHDVHVFAAHGHGGAGVKMHKVWGGIGPRVCRAVPFLVQNNLMIHGFDIVHTNGCDRIGADVITAHSIHRAGMEFDKSARGLGVLDKFCLAVERLNYAGRRYKKIICVSESSKGELMRWYGVPEEDIVVIYNGVDLEEFKPRKNWELRRVYGVGDDEILLMIVATEFNRKGVPELIEAVRGLGKCKLMVVGQAGTEGGRSGDWVYREMVRKYGLENRVIFTGKVDLLVRYYNAADIFVFPTKYEAFGIPVLEAMACGLPVVASKIGAGELIRDGVNGLHIDNPRDVGEIAAKVKVLADEDTLMSVMGENARKTALKYSWDECARRTMEVYESVGV